MLWLKVDPEKPPVPSDIVAGLVAMRMMANPSEFIIIKTSSDSYGVRQRVGVWEDKVLGIRVEVSTGVYEPFNSSIHAAITDFSRKGIPFAPTPEGRRQLYKAAAFCAQAIHDSKQADLQYRGDMNACDAIADLMGVKA